MIKKFSCVKSYMHVVFDIWGKAPLPLHLSIASIFSLSAWCMNLFVFEGFFKHICSISKEMFSYITLPQWHIILLFLNIGHSHILHSIMKFCFLTLTTSTHDKMPQNMKVKPSCLTRRMLILDDVSLVTYHLCLPVSYCVTYTAAIGSFHYHHSHVTYVWLVFLWLLICRLQGTFILHIYSPLMWLDKICIFKNFWCNICWIANLPYIYV